MKPHLGHDISLRDKRILPVAGVDGFTGAIPCYIIAAICYGQYLAVAPYNFITRNTSYPLDQKLAIPPKDGDVAALKLSMQTVAYNEGAFHDHGFHGCSRNIPDEDHSLQQK